jgi:hypothetical protein
MEFEIESGIPLPKSVGRKPKYSLELDKLAVDDRIKIPMSKLAIKTEHKIIRNYVLRYVHKNPSKRFTVRQLEDGVGVWRIK